MSKQKKPRPPAKPYVLCIGKWTSLALTAEIHGFELNERGCGMTPIGEVVATVIEDMAEKAKKLPGGRNSDS